MSSSEKFTCPRRKAEGRDRDDSPLTLDGSNLDDWDEDRQCSYDGSLHGDVFMEYVKAGKLVGSTDKSYKFYMDEYEGNVRGAKKFYTHHLSHEQAWEFYQLWLEDKVNFGMYQPYVPLYLPGVRERLQVENELKES